MICLVIWTIQIAAEVAVRGWNKVQVHLTLKRVGTKQSSSLLFVATAEPAQWNLFTRTMHLGFHIMMVLTRA